MARLKREIEKQIEDHFKAKLPTILLVEGARQVGKTTSIRNVGQRLFPNYIEINLFEDFKKRKIFANISSIDEFYLQLSAAYGEKLGNKDDTLIFLDEIQVYPELFPLLKFLKEDGRYTYIASGSSLGISLRRGKKEMESDIPLPYIPMGAIRVLKMHPLSFKEFLRANGYGDLALEDIKKHYLEETSLKEGNHKNLLDLFKLYLLIGGLPEAVNTYLATRNIARVRAIQQEIHSFYKEDASQYDRLNSLAIKTVYEYLPSSMENKKKRVIYKKIENNARAGYDNFLEEFDYLINSGIALPTQAVASPSYPLSQIEKKNLIKLYLNDVGLLSAILIGNNINSILNEKKGFDMGGIYECFVAQELSSKGLNLYYYDNKKLGEVDFLIDDADSLSVLPIEVKSGKDYPIHHALDNIISIKEYKIEKAIVLSNEKEVRRKGKILYMPIYYSMFIGEEKDESENFIKEIPPYEFD